MSRKKRPSRLGSPVIEHLAREKAAAADTNKLLKEARFQMKKGACSVGFGKLVDAVSYGGMAEAEARGAGDPARAKKHAKDVVAVVTLFKSKCLKG